MKWWAERRYLTTWLSTSSDFHMYLWNGSIYLHVCDLGPGPYPSICLPPPNPCRADFLHSSILLFFYLFYGRGGSSTRSACPVTKMARGGQAQAAPPAWAEPSRARGMRAVKNLRWDGWTSVGGGTIDGILGWGRGGFLIYYELGFFSSN